VPRHRIKKSTWVLSISAVAVTASVLFFFPSLVGNIRDLSVQVITFPVRVVNEAWTYLPTKKTLIEQNEILRKRLAIVALEAQQLGGLRVENDRLRDLLGLQKDLGLRSVPAEVIGRNPNDWIGSLVIDRGTSSGVERLSAVCSAKGLIGKVVDAGKDSSTVMLLTHPNFKAGGEISGTGINGVVMGSGKDTVKMIYIPVDAEVKEGATVTTSGMSRTFPRDIVIGRVIAVGKSRTGLYKYAIIKPSAFPFDQRELLCIQ
jgi:rod shape-determining protein MreC